MHLCSAKRIARGPQGDEPATRCVLGYNTLRELSQRTSLVQICGSQDCYSIDMLSTGKPWRNRNTLAVSSSAVAGFHVLGVQATQRGSRCQGVRNDGRCTHHGAAAGHERRTRPQRCSAFCAGTCKRYSYRGRCCQRGSDEWLTVVGPPGGGACQRHDACRSRGFLLLQESTEKEYHTILSDVDSIMQPDGFPQASKPWDHEV